MKTALLLIAHGSRVAAANDALHDVAAMVQAQSGFEIVEVCFREQHPDGIQQGIDSCVARGAQRILLYPYFLFPGKHVQQDLPKQMSHAARRYPGLEMALAEPFGVHFKLGEIVCQRVDEAMERAGWSGRPQP